MEVIGNDMNYTYHEIEIDTTMISVGYYFKITDETQTIFYGNNVFYAATETVSGVAYLDKMFVHSLTEDYDLFLTPSWVGNAVVYQIFPERFNRGSNYLPQKKHQPWGAAVHYESFHGGTIQGILEKLDYLSALGINTIYLNPIFKADSNHKYVTEDYYEIDPDFGNKEIFRQLVDTCHQRGMKIILDGVFSSTGPKFFAFKDLLENQEKSKYRDWYTVYNWPVELKNPSPIKAFAYYPVLPKLNYAVKEVRNYVMEVLEYWVREFDIDGWRLDCANEIPHIFWQEARRNLKELKPDLLLVGEVWYDSRAWLQGNELDSVMNYLFFTPVLDYIAHKKITATAFAEALMQFYFLYKKQTHQAMWNLIDSHDTSRFLHEANEDKRKLKIASLLQFCSLGMPVVYYGDEIGMTGANDPDCRRCMDWDGADEAMLDWYKGLAQLRKENEVLQKGRMVIELSDNERDIVIIQRIYGEQTAKIIINMSEISQEIKVSENYSLAYGEAKLENDMLVLSSISAVVLTET